MRPFRFGIQISGAADDIISQAQAAEVAGFDIVTMADHIGPGLAPLPALSAIASVTSNIRLGTFVINAEFRNPVQLAWDAVSLDRLSGGRFELGVGAGHTPAEFAAIGLAKASGRRRKQRLCETVEIVRQLLAGERVSIESDFFRLEGAQLDESRQQPLPILVGGNGDALLRHAGAHADIVGLQGLGRTLEDGHRHTVNFTESHLDNQVESIRAGAEAADRPMPELNALVQVAVVSDDDERVESTTADLLNNIDGLTRDQVDATPYVMVGSVDRLIDKIERCRERWGISYFVVRDREAFAPIVEALAGQ